MEQQLQDYIEHVQMAQLDAMRAKEAAETANAAKSDFLANMSHELRTPMHAILNYSKTGLKRLDPAQLGSEQIDKLQKYFTNIYVSGQRLSNLINDLLDVSKMEAGKMDFRIQELSVLTPVEHAVSELQPIYESKNIKIDIRRETQDLDIHLDRERMIQVVVNLLSNAVRFSPEHSTITIRFTDMEYNGAPALATMIEDQGVGIPEAELETIFDKFIQSSKTATGAGGTGLGLAICTQILHAHHGHIWAENRPEGGARFTFVIPREQPQKLAEAVGE